MATLLVVRAHPLQAPVSRSMRLTDAFTESYAANHPQDTIEDLRLYDITVPEIDLDLLRGWRALRHQEPFTSLTKSEQAKVTQFDALTAQFLAAERIVVANPLWNLSVPTRLKAWIDTITVSGKTFRYDAQGRPQGLVSGKRVAHLQASGGRFHGREPASAYLREMFGFLGVTDYHEVFAEGMDHEPDRAEEIMADALAQARALAADF